MKAQWPLVGRIWACVLGAAAFGPGCAPISLPDSHCFLGSDTKSCIKPAKPKTGSDLSIAPGDDTTEEPDATAGDAATSETADVGAQVADSAILDAAEVVDAIAEVQPSCAPADVCAKTAKGLAAGDRHSCAIVANNTVRCWGDNSYGQCGPDSKNGVELPTAVPMPAGTLKLIAAGGFHTCAAMANGDLSCWGRNDDGQLALGSKSKSEPKPAAYANLGAGIKSLTAGMGHTCAVKQSGAAYCWGDNSYGQLGNTTTASKDMPEPVAGAQTWAEISAGKYFTCGRTQSGAVYCWGENGAGQLGDGTKAEQHAPVAVKGLPGPAGGLATGAQHACAVMVDDGSVYCWGGNDDGELGGGDLSVHAAPVKAKLFGGAAAIAAGAAHTCALLDDDSVQCWGDGSHGQLATPGSIKSPTPMAITGLPKVLTQISAGTWHTCALNKLGALACWGDSANGQLGNGLATAKVEPIVLALSLPSYVVAGAYHVCAGLKSGGLQCWGDNGFQQLGNKDAEVQWTPQPASAIVGTIQALASGGYHNCMWTGGASAQCWGDNNDLQLGGGSKGSTPAPVSVMGLPALSATANVMLAAGHRHSCALASGVAYCWGNNDLGQLGSGSKNPSSSAVAVTGAPAEGFKSLFANGDQTCGLTPSGLVFCWGDNGHLQAGPASAGGAVLQPNKMNVAGAKGLWLGREHACALLGDGSTVCWGSNEDGQLGQAPGADQEVPVTVGGLGEPVQGMALGWHHSCAQSTKGAVRCWGANDKGQLGDGTGKAHFAPALVIGLNTGVAQVASGYMHSCAITIAGKTLCWGSNSLGQVGSGTQSVAVMVEGFAN